MRITRVTTVTIETLETISIWRRPAGGGPMTSEQLKHLIATYTDEAWNGRQVDAMDKYYATTYVHHDGARPDVRSLADYKQWARDLLAGLSDLHVAADDLIAEPGKAVKRWTATGVHSGDLAGIAPTGNRIAFSGISVYRFDGDRIVEGWYAYDAFGLLQQLGAMPAEAAANA
jgi:predicted ester cyclase